MLFSNGVPQKYICFLICIYRQIICINCMLKKMSVTNCWHRHLSGYWRTISTSLLDSAPRTWRLAVSKTLSGTLRQCELVSCPFTSWPRPVWLWRSMSQFCRFDPWGILRYVCIAYTYRSRELRWCFESYSLMFPNPSLLVGCKTARHNGVDRPT